MTTFPSHTADPVLNRNFDIILLCLEVKYNIFSNSRFTNNAIKWAKTRFPDRKNTSREPFYITIYITALNSFHCTHINFYSILYFFSIWNRCYPPHSIETHSAIKKSYMPWVKISESMVQPLIFSLNIQKIIPSNAVNKIWSKFPWNIWNSPNSKEEMMIANHLLFLISSSLLNM